jgi:hypothetical protein
MFLLVEEEIFLHQPFAHSCDIWKLLLLSTKAIEVEVNHDMVFVHSRRFT